jgi:DNA end-binding protein Ku
MAARPIASLSLSFGLVSIPIKVYSATENSAAMRFKLMASGGERVKQQYVTNSTPATQKDPDIEEAAAEPQGPASNSRGAASKVVALSSSRQEAAPSPSEMPATVVASVIERSATVKGYEYQKGRFVLFTPEELKALEEGSRQTIDIVSFIPEDTIDPIYYNKAYFLAPEKRGSKPYSLLLRAMQDTRRCAIARWSFRSKEYVAQIRAAGGGIVLQQLFYAEEVRSLADLHIEVTDVGDAELKLAKQLIEHISADSYDPTQFVDEEKKRILAAVAEKIAGKSLPPKQTPAKHGQVIDLLAALRASLQNKPDAGGTVNAPTLAIGQRKPAKRARIRSAEPARLRKGRKP